MTWIDIQNHDAGNRYLWEVSSRINEVPLGELPAWLLKLMNGAESGSTNGTKSFDPPPIFQDGTRNDYLYRTARSAHAKFNLNADELLNLLRGINQSRCRPPVNENELSKIANNAATQPDRPDFKPGPAVDPNVESSRSCRRLNTTSAARPKRRSWACAPTRSMKRSPRRANSINRRPRRPPSRYQQSFRGRNHLRLAHCSTKSGISSNASSCSVLSN